MRGDKKAERPRRLWDGPGTDWRAVSAALLATAAIHAALMTALPREFSLRAQYQDERVEELELEMIPPETEKPLPPEYVEANPDANMLPPPPDARFESFQDQRAAQENPVADSDSDMPRVDGEMEESKKIVSGNLMEEPRRGAEERVFETLERPLENPSAHAPEPSGASGAQSGGEGPEARSPESREPSQDGETPRADIPSSLPEAGHDEPSPSENPEPEPGQAAESLPKPKPRPRLSMRTPPGPLAASNTDANALGLVAVNSRFSQFGAYQQRMVEAIARQWHLLGSNYDLTNATNTQVVVEFFLDRTGNITSMRVPFSTSTQTGRSLCEQAILTTAPYGDWTEEMVSAFGGQNQSVTFTFYYR